MIIHGGYITVAKEISKAALKIRVVALAFLYTRNTLAIANKNRLMAINAGDTAMCSGDSDVSKT